jgi:hypothetical protein
VAAAVASVAAVAAVAADAVATAGEPKRCLMGYDLRITRSLDWSDNRGHEISPQEWHELLGADPDLVPDPDSGQHAVRFGATRWLDWFEGNVFTTDPDHATVAKMVAIADILSAAIQGDDGEFYESASQWSRARKKR